MKYIGNIKKFKKVKLVKKGLGVAVLVTTIFMGGCSTQNNYYMITDNNKTYICTKAIVSTNADDYDYVSINDDELIGSVCTKKKSFDYSCHRIVTNFLNELQVEPLDNVFEQLNLDDSILSNWEELRKFANTNTLNNIRINYYLSMKYDLNKKFIYTEDSKLELFDTPDGVIIGYDISPNRIEQKNHYLYSIIDMDVISFAKNDDIKNISVGIYLTDYQKTKGYLTYGEALSMLKKYTKHHYHRPLVKSK